MNDDDLTAAVQAAFGCELHDYAGMHVIDAWAERDQALVAYVERKTRSIDRATYPTALLDERKWVGLIAAEFATGLPAILAYAWADGWGWCRPAHDIPVTVRIATTGPDTVSRNRGVPRPVVDIPLTAFTMVEAS